jgi:hypothetical protein
VKQARDLEMEAHFRDWMAGKYHIKLKQKLKIFSSKEGKPRPV